MLGRPLEVHDTQKLAVVDDGRRDLASDVLARGAVVGIDPDVWNELDLAGRGRPSDDPEPDLDLVEGRRIAGDADHRQSVPPERQIHRHERDVEFVSDVVDDGLDHLADRLRAIEPGHDPVHPLEDGHPLPILRGQPGRAILGLRRDSDDEGQSGGRQEGHDEAHHELVGHAARLARQADDLGMGDEHRERPPR